ncbi:hypothetical protein D3OALGA1CA_3273 [Olavius algarvensis associated proteobacterium Delta 3]|nr:hypothetical protein D3OALGA1CA_3273 [Olavius algarvensis associated proteobacterium Delta 3]
MPGPDPGYTIICEATGNGTACAKPVTGWQTFIQITRFPT